VGGSGRENKVRGGTALTSAGEPRGFFYLHYYYFIFYYFIIIFILTSTTIHHPRITKPHPNFRLFLAMDAQFGEISRAMRNRCVEIALPLGLGCWKESEKRLVEE
jgi:hypothetical protein